MMEVLLVILLLAESSIKKADKSDGDEQGMQKLYVDHGISDVLACLPMGNRKNS